MILFSALFSSKHLNTNTGENKFLSSGVQAMFLSTLAFSLTYALVKQLSHLPTIEVAFFRCAIASLICFAGIYRGGIDWRGSNRKLLLLRGFFGTTAVYLFFFTLQRIPLAGAVTIQYLSPIFTTIIAIFILKERVKRPQWLFYAIAFCGVLLIERFDPRISIVYLLTGIGAAFCSGVAYNLVRSLREREHPLTIVLHFQLFGAVVCFFAMWFDWVTPVGWDWFYLLLIGVFSQIGQVFLTHALQKEKAAGVVIINYSGVVYGLLIGWFFFNETQTFESLSGMLLVVCGVALSVFYGKRQRELEKLEATIS
ncbi:MAG TPA: DMT family transporter [Pyrinomonadaceae bacterium]|nr:DMT family transporter [Pyrinomonadaceae bacterium]